MSDMFPAFSTSPPPMNDDDWEEDDFGDFEEFTPCQDNSSTNTTLTKLQDHPTSVDRKTQDTNEKQNCENDRFQKTFVQDEDICVNNGISNCDDSEEPFHIIPSKLNTGSDQGSSSCVQTFKTQSQNCDIALEKTNVNDKAEASVEELSSFEAFVDNTDVVSQSTNSSSLQRTSSQELGNAFVLLDNKEERCDEEISSVVINYSASDADTVVMQGKLSLRKIRYGNIFEEAPLSVSMSDEYWTSSTCTFQDKPEKKTQVYQNEHISDESDEHINATNLVPTQATSTCEAFSTNSSQHTAANSQCSSRDFVGVSLDNKENLHILGGDVSETHPSSSNDKDKDCITKTDSSEADEDEVDSSNCVHSSTNNDHLKVPVELHMHESTQQDQTETHVIDSKDSESNKDNSVIENNQPPEVQTSDLTDPENCEELDEDENHCVPEVRERGQETFAEGKMVTRTPAEGELSWSEQDGSSTHCCYQVASQNVFEEDQEDGNTRSTCAPGNTRSTCAPGNTCSTCAPGNTRSTCAPGTSSISREGDMDSPVQSEDETPVQHLTHDVMFPSLDNAQNHTCSTSHELPVEKETVACVEELTDDEFGDFADFSQAQPEQDVPAVDQGIAFADFQGPDHLLPAESSSGGWAEEEGFANFSQASFSGTKVQEENNEFSDFEAATQLKLPSDDDDDNDDFLDFQEPLSQKSDEQSSLDNTKVTESLHQAICDCFGQQQSLGSAGDFSLIENMSEPLSEDQANRHVGMKIWSELNELEASGALRLNWTQSQSHARLLKAVNIDVSNMLIGHKKKPTPVFASGLGMLEPSKASSVLLISKDDPPHVSKSASQEIPEASFDWAGSGLQNPLQSSSSGLYLQDLDLDFFTKNTSSTDSEASLTANTLDDDMMSTLEITTLPKHTAAAPTFNKILQSYTKQTETEEKLGEEASKILEKLPKLDYMLAKVFMFPIKDSNYEE